MRWLLLAFALGVLALQQEAQLPPLARAAWVALPLTIALCAWLVCGRFGAWGRRVARCIAILSAAVSVALSGFFYAAWRADARLADALPTAWEGRDIDLIGVVDELPQAAERGARFAF